MQAEETNITAVIPIFKPTINDVGNIIRNSLFFKECIIIDDSGNNINLFSRCINNNVVYLYNEIEYGLSETVNRGIKIAIDRGAEWVMLINQDNIIHDDIVSVFNKYIMSNKDPDIALLAPQYNYDRHKRKCKHGSKNIRYTDMTGSVISVNAWNKIGAYDTRFFIDGLDVEWCLRARKKGYKLIQCREAIMEHHPGETKELRIFGLTIWKYGWHKPERYYYQFKAAFLIHTEYHDFKTDLFAMYKLIKVLLLFKNKSEYISMFKLARTDYLNNQFGKLNAQ